jgi:Protein of unknown function (DUF4238)
MPERKNQHFVPRCALKPFTLNTVGLAINVFNIARERSIKNAAVKGRCARDYLYGKDLEAEKHLGKLEGQYARILAQLEAGKSLSDADKEWLRLFIFIQVRRTESAIRQMREAGEGLADATFKHHPEQRPPDERTDENLMLSSMRLGMQLMPYVKDLKVSVFHNKTAFDFITCDNPAVLTNRFHFQRLKQRSFGVSNSGAILSMPLSPRMSAILYDGGVYSLPNASGTPFLDLKKTEDVAAINDLQFLAAGKNLYFSRWQDADTIRSAMTTVSSERDRAGPKTTVFVRDPDSPNVEQYRRGTPEEEATARHSMITSSFQYPEPSRWPSPLKFRDKPKVYSNGSAIGHVRNPDWLTSRAFDPK